MIILFLGIVLCLIYGLSELGGVETFLTKVDKNLKYWDNTKKYSNNYELIYIPNKNNRKNSIFPIIE